MYPQFFQQTTYAMYGSPRSFYGNIQYGSELPYLHGYGAWPEEKPVQEGMLYGDWQEPQEDIIPDDRARNIEIIRKLRERLAQTEDAVLRQQIREEIEKSRKAKVKAFIEAADEEETLFILLH